MCQDKTTTTIKQVKVLKSLAYDHITGGNSRPEAAPECASMIRRAFPAWTALETRR